MGNLLASCSKDEEVMVWNIENTAALQVLSGHTNVVECVAFAGSHAVAALQSKGNGVAESVGQRPTEFLASGSRDKTIRLWDVLKGTCLAVFKGHDNWVRMLVFSGSGKYLYSVSDDKSIRLWELATGGCSKKVLEAHAHFILCLGVNPRFPMLATGSVDKSVKVWECR